MLSLSPTTVGVGYKFDETREDCCASLLYSTSSSQCLLCRGLTTSKENDEGDPGVASAALRRECGKNFALFQRIYSVSCLNVIHNTLFLTFLYLYDSSPSFPRPALLFLG